MVEADHVRRSKVRAGADRHVNAGAEIDLGKLGLRDESLMVRFRG